MELKPLSCGVVCGQGPRAFHGGDPNLLSYSGMFQIISAHGLCPFLRNSSSPFFSCCISFWPPLRTQCGHPLLGGGSPTLRVSPDGPRHTASAVTHLFLSLHVRATQACPSLSLWSPMSVGPGLPPLPQCGPIVTVTVALRQLLRRAWFPGCSCTASPPCLSPHSPAPELWVPL